MPETGKSSRPGRKVSPRIYRRPGLSSLSPRNSQVQRIQTSWDVPRPCRRCGRYPAGLLLPGSDLDGLSIALSKCPNRLVNADVRFVKQRVGHRAIYFS